MDTVRVAVYARRSKARPDSSEASPEARVAAGEAPVASRGWEVVHTFKDVGGSGWDPDVSRPSFEDLRSAVRAGDPDAPRTNALPPGRPGGFAGERVQRGNAHVNVIARDEGGAPLTPRRGVIAGADRPELQERRSRRSKTDGRIGGAATPALLSGWRFTTSGICTGSPGQSRNNGGQDSCVCADPKGRRRPGAGDTRLASRRARRGP